VKCPFPPQTPVADHSKHSISIKGVDFWAPLASMLSHGFLSFSQTGIISLYDCVFKRSLDYNQKVHRDDREHAKGLGLHVNEEVRLTRSYLTD
jgi:hypothetical protein